MSKSTKTTTENKPPAWAEPLFKQSADEAQKLYASGSGGNTYMGSTVSPLSNTTMSGVNQLAQAGQGWDTAGTRPLYQGIGAASASDPFVNKLAGVAGGVNAQNVGTSDIVGKQVGTSQYGQAQNAAQGIGSTANNLLSGIATGGQGINTEADFRNVLSSAQQPTAASQYLTDTASGKYLTGEGNPFYRERLEREIADSNAKIQSAFSGSGRYGSGANQSVIADNTRDMLMEGLENDWNRERGLQMQAVGMLDDANQAALGTQLGAVSGISGVQGQNIGNRLAASGQMLGAQSDMASQLRGIADSQSGIMTGNADRSLQAATTRAGIQAGNADRGLAASQLQGNLLSQAGQLRGAGLDRALSSTNAMAGLDQQNFENRLAGAGATLQAGNILDQQSQAQLSDEVAKFYALDNQDWNRLSMLQAAAAGSAGNYGVQNSTQRTPINPWGAIGSLFAGKGA